MDIRSDFTLILTLATFVTGIVYVLDKFVLEAKRQQAGVEKEPAVVDFSKSFFPVLALVLVIRSFIAEPFRIPSGSMIPTLLVGDFIVVSKFSYGIKLPVVDKKIIETGEPERGDVVVFRYPENPDIDYIKRVIGVPGDSVFYRDNRLFINGDEVPVEDVAEFNYIDIYDRPNYATEKTELLPGRTHQILNHRNSPGLNGQITKVPEGQYFVMGDNRDRSKDSRVWGLVPEENLVGKAQFIWMHWGLDGLKRIGTGI